MIRQRQPVASSIAATRQEGHHMLRRIARLGIAVLFVASVAGTATAASPHQLDPDQMIPPLNPAFGAWICTETGSGSVCRGELHDAWSGEDTGLACDGQAIYTTGVYDSQGTRWHLPDGRATRTFFQDAGVETWTMSPDGTGRAINVSGHWEEHYVYPVPGDRDTRIETWTGPNWQVTAQGTGLVFHDVGFLRFNPGVGEGIDYAHGPTDSDYGDLDLVIDDICAALVA